ncbi:MAG: MBL fold metallo-hydrolase [Bacilli bacterium]
MTTRIRFLGVAGYEIEWSNHRVLIDPFLTGSRFAPCSPDELATPDVILVTHSAWDHIGDTAAIAKRTGAPVVCGSDTHALLREAGIPTEQMRQTVWGIVVKVGGVVVRPVESHHWAQARLKDGATVSGVPMGFLIETDPDVRIYHCGDTAVFGDMRLIADLYQPTVGLLGCSQAQDLLRQVPGAGEVLTGEMSPRDAAFAAELLRLPLAIASHYLDIDDEQGPEYADVQEFLQAVAEFDSTKKRNALAMRVGESLMLDEKGFRLEGIA